MTKLGSITIWEPEDAEDEGYYSIYEDLCDDFETTSNHAVERIIEMKAKKQMKPELFEKLVFDSEADGFSVMSKDAEAIFTIVLLLNNFIGKHLTYEEINQVKTELLKK